MLYVFKRTKGKHVMSRSHRYTRVDYLRFIWIYLCSTIYCSYGYICVALSTGSHGYTRVALSTVHMDISV